MKWKCVCVCFFFSEKCVLRDFWQKNQVHPQFYKNNMLLKRKLMYVLAKLEKVERNSKPILST